MHGGTTDRHAARTRAQPSLQQSAAQALARPPTVATAQVFGSSIVSRVISTSAATMPLVLGKFNFVQPKNPRRRSRCRAFTVRAEFYPLRLASGAETERLSRSRRFRLKHTAYVAIGCFGLLGACSGQPVSSPTPIAGPAPHDVTLTLAGQVHDNANRPVPGATVEVIDGAPSGQATITDSSGSFSFGGVTVIVGETKLQASKEGYATSLTDFPGVPAPSYTASITLWSLTPPGIHPGEYTMSFVSDNTCDLTARTRTYSAAVTLPKYSENLPPERQADFGVTLSGGSSFVVGQDISPTDSLTVHAVGDYLTFVLDPYDFGGYITERLAPATFVQLLGSVAGFIRTSGVSSLPFNGVFAYCVKSSDDVILNPWQGPFGCSSSDPVYRSCSSNNHRVVLTPR